MGDGGEGRTKTFPETHYIHYVSDEPYFLHPAIGLDTIVQAPPTTSAYSPSG